MRRASLNASFTAAPAPGAEGIACRHTRRWSSDRKKFSDVQRDVAMRRSPSRRVSTHTMTPSASGSGPLAPTSNASGS